MAPWCYSIDSRSYIQHYITNTLLWFINFASYWIFIPRKYGFVQPIEDENKDKKSWIRGTIIDFIHC